MVSGYLLVNKYEGLKEKNEDEKYSSFRYTKERLNRLFPFCMFAFIVNFVITAVYNSYSFSKCIEELIYHIPEIILIQMAGFGFGSSYPINSVTWYISVLLIVGYFFWHCVKKNRTLFTKLFCPLFVLLIYPYLYKRFGFIGEHWGADTFLISPAILRGIAGMSLGVIAYSLKDKIKDRNNNLLKVISFITLTCGIVILPLFSYKTGYDYLSIVLIFAGVTSAFAAEDCSLNESWKKVISNFAAITTSIYINHKIFRNVFTKLFPVFNAGVTVYGAIVYYLMKKIVFKKVKE